MNTNGLQAAYPFTATDVSKASDAAVAEMLNVVIKERNALRSALERISYEHPDQRSVTFGSDSYHMRLIARAALTPVSS